MEKNNPKEIRIRELSPAKVKTIQNIARFHGYTVGRFLKFELTKLIESFPDHIKNYSEEQ